MPLVESVRSQQVFTLEPARVASKCAWSDYSADPEVDFIARDRRRHEQQPYQHRIQGSRPIDSGKSSDSEEQRIARQKGCYDQTCLAKNNQKQDAIGPC